jgi:hypothetical protein
MTTATPQPHVFISYKREDQAQAQRLALRLQQQGLKVWIDSDLPGGEAWRDNIEQALQAAGCVVVLWSHTSVGPQGHFVKSEADRGLKRGVLVSVVIDKGVMPPLGLDAIHAFDLSAWKGSPRDPVFQDLAAAVQAKLAGQPVPPARAGRALWQRRLAAGGATGLLAALGWALAVNLLGTQDKLCSLPVAQPGLSDLCGRWGLAGRPDQAERLAWEARPAGSCEALRQHVQRFPNGALRAKAADLIASARVARATAYTPAPREAQGYVRQGATGQADEAKARADALARAQADAQELSCAPVPPHERLTGAKVEAKRFDCRRLPDGSTTCALDYRSQCSIETLPLVETCG